MHAQKSTMSRLLAGFAGCVLPPTCCLCDSPGGRDLRGFPLDLCAICVEMLPSSPKALRSEWQGLDTAFAPYLYGYPVDHLIRRLKFGGQRVYGRLLGQLLAAAIANRPGPRPQVLVPMPLHVTRRRQRGFNQAHDIARYVGCTLGLPLDMNLLARVNETREQSGLTLAERRVNVRGAFAALREPRATHVALIDDVLTTGCTAAEAARVLKVAGVERVEVWAAARAEHAGVRRQATGVRRVGKRTRAKRRQI
jgi:ComF family protein